MIKFNQRLKSTDDRNYHVTSDLHFFHKNVMKFCPDKRPWSGVEEMNEALIEHWNNTVSENDVIFHLGDLSFKAKEATSSIIERLNGDVVFIAGNHDYKVFDQLNLKYHHYFEVNFDGVKVCMMHFPIVAWNQQGRGSVMIHGHTHSNYQGEGRTVDVGWDNWGKILSLKESVDFCLEREIYCPWIITK